MMLLQIEWCYSVLKLSQYASFIPNVVRVVLVKGWRIIFEGPLTNTFMNNVHVNDAS